MKSPSQFTLVLFLSLPFMSFFPPSQADFAFVRHHVHIINNLPGDLILHCQSKDNDLGVRTLHPGEEQMIRFRVNIWMTTHFYCLAQSEWKYKYFDAFKVKRDKFRCGKQCYWSIRDDGIYYSSDGTGWVRYYTWE